MKYRETFLGPKLKAVHIFVHFFPCWSWQWLCKDILLNSLIWVISQNQPCKLANRPAEIWEETALRQHRESIPLTGHLFSTTYFSVAGTLTTVVTTVLFFCVWWSHIDLQCLFWGFAWVHWITPVALSEMARESTLIREFSSRYQEAAVNEIPNVQHVSWQWRQ